MTLIGIHGKLGSGKDMVGTIIQYLMEYTYSEYTHPITEDDFNSYMRNEHHLTSRWRIVKFADKLKEVVSLILGMPDFIEKWDKNENDFRNQDIGDEWEYTYYTPVNGNKVVQRYTYRTFMQTLGTDAGRDEIHPNIWVNTTMSSYIPYSARGSDYEFEESKWIITDLRFPNELEAITKRDGIIIKVERPTDYSHIKNDITRMILENSHDFGKVEQHESETSLDYYKFTHVIKNDGTVEDLIYKVYGLLQSLKII